LPSLAPKTDSKVQGVFNAVEKHIAPGRVRDETAGHRLHFWSQCPEKKSA
jgi:hypothetical protein